jgi:putative DNA primase/helicase
LTGKTWPAPRLAEARHRRQHVASSNRPGAIRIWHESEPLFGTRAEVYLQSRGIDLDQIPDIDDVLRYHAACPFGEERRLPCLVTLFRDIKTDAPIGIMRTAIDEHGRKIDRLALGDKQGGAFKLWPDALITYRLIVGEGMETVARAATRIEHCGIPLQPAWALVDAGNLAAMPPLSGVETLIILVDNDASGTGQRAADECARIQYAAGCRDIELLTPNGVGEDFADLPPVRRAS